ncbi:hypothetical protein HY640_03445 [Candidatus Woesearchaeota archaeon]|nr:hypothetical protein [Candidatus Woesearchaeota archaeon]
MKSDVFYVGIDEPSQLRRSVLEASKDLIRFMQRYERLKAVRSEKYAQTARLRALYHEVIGLISDLKADLPRVDVKSLPRYEDEPKKKAQQPEQVEKKVVKRMSGVERLEAELGQIEEKLRTLG